MTTVFGKEGNDFYSAFYIMDPAKRREALDSWIERTTPTIQDAVGKELKMFVKSITKNRWTDEEWRTSEKKFHNMQNDYHLIMEINLRKINPGEEFAGELPFRVPNTVQSSTVILPQIAQAELDLHGKTINEALSLVDIFLENNYVSNVRRVWIIHGKGTGVLRKEIRQYLKNHRLVRSFATADSTHGGEGAVQVNIVD